MDEHDYKKMIRFMKKSLKSFKKEAIQITKPFIDNIDFLIVNFPYFSDIKMVSEYFMTKNEEFNRVFYAKFHLFFHILNYNSNILHKSEYYDDISMSKLKLWNNVLGRSGREKLKKLWSRKKEESLQKSNNEIYTLNEQDLVLKLFFNIINFHYKYIKEIILDHLDIKKVLENLHIDDILIDKILDKSKENIFQGIENVPNIFIEAEKYFLLEKYFFNSHDKNKEYLDIERLVFLFLTSPDYLDYKAIYNILKLKADTIPIYQDFILQKRSFLNENKFICSETKYLLYISLLNINPVEMYNRTPELYKFLIGKWLVTPNNSFLAFHVYNFLKRNCLFSEITDKIKEAYRNGFSESVKSKPKKSTLFSYCKLILNLNNLDNINYNELEKINEYIDQCFDESFMRYICKLVIDEVPTLNIFEKNRR